MPRPALVLALLVVCRVSAIALVVGYCINSAGVRAQADEQPLSTEGALAALIEQCGRCHGLGDEPQGAVDFIELRKHWPQADPAQLQQALDALELRHMPPSDQAPLSPQLRRQLAAGLKNLLHHALGQQPGGGQAPIRRLNRFQYHNAVIDLFQLNCEVFTLPERMLREYKNYFQPASGRMPDVITVGCRPLGKSQLIEPRLDGVAPFPQDPRAAHGFDNRGDHLSLSPLLMEAFLKLGQSITHSRDFTSQTVGIWDEFFAEPVVASTEATAEASATAYRAIIRERLTPFLTRAFRRPVEAETLERYGRFAEAHLAQGKDFTAAMQAVSAAAISSPNFLYLYEASHSVPGAAPLSDLELATRLSFFLWGSLPDQELLEAAIVKGLQTDELLLQQTERLLRDDKLKRFCDSFPAQWLQLERILSTLPDQQQYPEFYIAKYRASMHMLVEPLLLFETVLVENRPITQLIDADFTYRSSLLQQLHADPLTADEQKRARAPEVTTLTFRRQPLADRRYGGVITNAAVLAMTSGRTRTQPITRGAWLATVIFNDPPAPPPADVPPLPETPEAGDELLTLREQLELHRQRADCRGCHERIDPLGFALENYNVLGLWRETYENGGTIDASGLLLNQHAFTNPVEFKDAILAEKDRFTRALAEHLLSFATARAIEPSDQPAIDEIAQATAADGYRIQTMLRQVVLSKPFRYKFTSSPAVSSDEIQPTD